jgi:23S rRNA (pseudouridine1915-N3)-methyltransferase
MKLKISTIGKLKSGPEQDLFSRYLTRSRKIGLQLGFSAILLQEFPESRNPSASRRKQQEAELLFSTAGKGGVIVAFDENGKDLSSPQFSRYLGNELDCGTKELVLALGGPDGLDSELLARAKSTLRFGRMTWPHQLARILLAEQLYRAMTILSGHPYHRQ